MQLGVSKPLAIVIIVLSAIWATAQQSGDPDYHFEITDPAFSRGAGPRLCFDEAHHNFHTSGGRYAPFARLLRADGFDVEPSTELFSETSLEACDVVVIANAVGEANSSEWTYPHPSAFGRSELEAVLRWIEAGGRLLLFADHAPMAGAARDLGAMLGIAMVDGYASGGSNPDVFRLEDGTLRDHDILQGRGSGEPVTHVATFTGQAVKLTDGWQPLLVFGNDARMRLSLPQGFQQGPYRDWPSFSVAGWTHGAARIWKQGRIVFFGEAAMCTAQLAGPAEMPMGMNHPLADQNAQFCLNTVRWLTEDLGTANAPG